MPLSLLALAAGAFGIGTTEFIIMGLLTQVGADLGISIPTAGTLISRYAVGVAVGAPLLTIATRHWPRKQLLMALMLIFIAGNAAAALAPGYGWLMGARVLTSLTHGTFFGVGAVVATGLVPAEKRASAIALMFSGLTLATLLGVPAGAWIGQLWGWRASFWVVALVGVAALAILAAFVPRDQGRPVVAPLSQELAVLRRPQVWLGLGITVFGFAGVFALYIYIEPLLRQVTHMSDGWLGHRHAAAVRCRSGGRQPAGRPAGGQGRDAGAGRQHRRADGHAGARPLGVRPARRGDDLRGAAGHRGLRHRGADADARAATGGRGGRQLGVEPEHLGLQPGQRAGRLGRRAGAVARLRAAGAGWAAVGLLLTVWSWRAPAAGGAGHAVGSCPVGV